MSADYIKYNERERERKRERERERAKQQCVCRTVCQLHVCKILR